MKQHVLAAFLLATTFAVNAQTRTSVANGNATNPLTWDCLCVPLPGNNIIINHAVILDNDFAYTSGSVTINASGSLTGTTTNRFLGVGGGSFTNNGTTNIYNLYYSAGTFVNNGTINVTNGLLVDGSGNLQNFNDLNVDDSLLINSGATLTNPASTYATYLLSAGTIQNTGSLHSDDFYNNGTVNNHTGMGIGTLRLFTNGNFTNGGLVQVQYDFYNSENFINNNHLVVNNNLYNGDSIAGTAVLTNNGTASIGNDLYNSETMNGNGSYCVAQGSSNSGDVSGTLFFCDNTGSDFDFNIGTIGSGVTYCSGSCNVGVANENELTGNIYPNPVSQYVNIELNASGNYDMVVVNSVGENVLHKNFTGNRTSIDMQAMAPGVYLYRITKQGQQVSGTLVKQ